MVRRRVATVVTVVVAQVGVLVAVLALAERSTAQRTETASSPAAPSGGRAGAAAAAPEAAVPLPDGTGSGTDDRTTTGGDPGRVPDGIGRDVVRTAQLTLQVADPTAATRGVRTAVAAAGGLVAEEQADTRGSWLVLRVPVAGLDKLVDDLAATGTVLARSSRAEDATEQVVDLDSRVATQQASVTRVRALLAQATSIGDIVAVESELARREADLDSLERRLATLRDRVAMSTLTVELRGPATTEPGGSPPGFGSGLGAGWAGLKVIGTALAAAAGFLLPFLPLLAIGAAVGWFVVRRRRTRRTSATGSGPGPEGVV
jgi:hypothetical protein